MQAIDHIEVRYRRADTVGAWTTFTIQNGKSTGQIAGIQRGMTYQVEARSIGKNGAASIWVSQTHTVADTTLLPLAPASLVALSVADGVHLTWTISGPQRADVEYDVERTNDVSGTPNAAGWVNITNVKATAYTDGLTDGIARWYRVRAVDFQALASAFSNSVLGQNKSVANGADKTADQPIVYTSSNIIPNGTFLFADIDGWFSPDNVAGYNAGVGGLLLGTSGDGVVSPSFPVIPGQKYRLSFTGRNTQTGTQSVTHRIAGSPSHYANIDPGGTGNIYHDFLVGGSLTPTLTAYTYDWTCPAGIYYASLAMYETGAAQLGYTNVSAQDYGAADEWGANKTENNTSANTVAVGTVPAGDVENTINAGGGVDFLNPGNTNQGDLSKVNQANTINIVAGAVNSNIVYQSSVVINVPVNTITVVAQATIATDGGYVKVRVTMMLFGGSSTNYAYPQIIMRKGDASGTQMVFYGNVFVPLSITPGGGASCVTLEAIDSTPDVNQQYTITVFSNTQAIQVNPISLVLENAKV